MGLHRRESGDVRLGGAAVDVDGDGGIDDGFRAKVLREDVELVAVGLIDGIDRCIVSSIRPEVHDRAHVRNSAAGVGIGSCDSDIV